MTAVEIAAQDFTASERTLADPGALTVVASRVRDVDVMADLFAR